MNNLVEEGQYYMYVDKEGLNKYKVIFKVISIDADDFIRDRCVYSESKNFIVGEKYEYDNMSEGKYQKALKYCPQYNSPLWKTLNGDQ